MRRSSSDQPKHGGMGAFVPSLRPAKVPPITRIMAIRNARFIALARILMVPFGR